MGAHRIVHIFDDGPRQDIRKILLSYEIQGQTVDVFRMGYSDIASQNLVILKVTVKERTNPLRVQDAANDCLDCLRRYEA